MIAGCYKDPNYDQLSSNFTVVTNRDLNVQFSNFKTYYVSDTVAFTSSASRDSFLLGADAQAVISAVKTNMNARGYSFVPKSSHPDLGLNVGVIKDLDVGVIYPGWWYGYPGWWYGGYWGWYYPYYYPWGVPYVISSGNVIVDMINLKDLTVVATERKLPVIWTGFGGGGLGSTNSVNTQLVVDAINKAFIQSPYIQSNK